MMNINANLITCADENKVPPLEHARFFSLHDKNFLWSADAFISTDFLEKLVFSVARKPNRLVTHLQRIYYCFDKNWTEQLYAAIVDFLVILSWRGQAISWRVVLGAKSRLTDAQFQTLKNYLKKKHDNENLLLGNQYSIFSKGLRGSNDLIQQVERSQEIDYDPLELAKDHIEYSQLEQAKQVLEQAVINDPARFELQRELIDLYQSTRDSVGFNEMLVKLTQLGINITDEWMQLTDYFKGRDSNG